MIWDRFPGSWPVGLAHREQLEGLFKDIPPKLQGAVDWESN
jgi:hypothetical protein